MTPPAAKQTAHLSCKAFASDWAVGLLCAVAGHGRVLLALCNPFFTFHGSTPFQTRSTPPGHGYSSVCCWQKTLCQLGQGSAQAASMRQDVHRPLSAVLHDLARRGLALDW